MLGCTWIWDDDNAFDCMMNMYWL